MTRLINEQRNLDRTLVANILFEGNFFFLILMQLFSHLFELYCTFYDELSSYQAVDNHMPHVYQINFALCHLNLLTQFSAEFGV